MDHQQFNELFLASLKGPLPEWLDLENEAIASFHLDSFPIQDSFRFRARHLGFKVASLLLDEMGEINREKLEELSRLLEKTPFLLGPRRENDALIYDHIRLCLRLLQEKKEIWLWIKKFSPPLCHKKAEELIRDTLWPETFRMVQTVHVRKAVLAAWLTLLRQATGSCFATAPAILVQQKDPIRFFQDIYDLLTTGQIKRIVAGKEYTVPLSTGAVTADLQRQAPHLERSFGLQLALESVGVLSLPKSEGTQSVESALRAATLASLQLTEEDLEEEERLSKIQMTSLLARQGGVYYQKPTERAQKTAEWRKKFAKACKAFLSITECALLRAWEYTLACLCDVKTEFARWNLFIGLGMHPSQGGGIGEFLYRQIDAHFQAAHGELELLSREYEQEMGTLNALETMIQAAGSESRASQLKAEWTSHQVSANSLLEMRDRLIEKIGSLENVFPSLIEQYDQKLQENFQELFDPALGGQEGHIHDDSPAGFRLVYKHGRSDASQWTPIYEAEGYIQCLRDFFSHIENDLTAPPSLGKEFLSLITTALVQYIQQPEFLSGSLLRSKEMGRRSPWDYISGGTLQTLLQAYCNRDRPFTESKIIPHSEAELLRFLIQEKKKEPLLIHSPTHAFLFFPQLLDERSESWVEQNQQEVRKWNWDEESQEHLVHRVSERLPEEERALFIHLYRQKHHAVEKGAFRAILIDALGSLRNAATLVDSVLYEQTPLLNPMQAKTAIEQILFSLGHTEKIEKLNGSFFGPYDLLQNVKSILLEKFKNPFSSEDGDMKIAEAMRRLGYLQPHLVLFADTNWSGWFFGFLVNPATAQLELWRLNRNGTQGFPMTDWKEFLSPNNQSPWVILSKPHEYTF